MLPFSLAMLPFSLANTGEAYYNRRKYMERG